MYGVYVPNMDMCWDMYTLYNQIKHGSGLFWSQLMQDNDILNFLVISGVVVLICNWL